MVCKKKGLRSYAEFSGFGPCALIDVVYRFYTPVVGSAGVKLLYGTGGQYYIDIAVNIAGKIGCGSYLEMIGGCARNRFPCKGLGIAL